jgi:hypothetical protein
LCIFPAVAALAVTLLMLSPARREAVTSAASPSFASPEKTIAAVPQQRLLASFGALPLAFEQNQGQTDPQVKFLARTNAYTLFLTKHEAVFSFRPKPSESAVNARGRSAELRAHHHAKSPDAQKDSAAALRMHLAGANTESQVTGADRLPGISNYFLGNNPKNWHTKVPQYSRIAYKNVYPGVDLTF